MELLIARNPDPESSLAYLMRLPLGDGLVLRTAGTWPPLKALYCYPVSVSEWPADAEIVERVGVRSCVRRGAAIDLVLNRSRENRSQLVFTTARGREAVFWQSPRTRKQSRPNVTTPTARAGGIAELEILVDAHERYPYRFADKAVRTVKSGLPCGDCGIVIDDRLAAAVERKSLPDLIASLTSGRLGFALGELAALPRAAVVVERSATPRFTSPSTSARRSWPTGWPNGASRSRPWLFCSNPPCACLQTAAFVLAHTEGRSAVASRGAVASSTPSSVAGADLGAGNYRHLPRNGR